MDNRILHSTDQPANQTWSIVIIFFFNNPLTGSNEFTCLHLFSINFLCFHFAKNFLNNDILSKYSVKFFHNSLKYIWTEGRRSSAYYLIPVEVLMNFSNKRTITSL